MDLPSIRERLSGFRVILHHPNHPGNVGAVARAMSNFGLKDLRIVGDLEVDAPDARRMSMGGRPILLAARRAATFEEAAADCRWLIGTSPRLHATWDLVDPRRKAPEWIERAASGTVAFLLGNEIRGLSNLHLSRCHEIAAIPTVGGNPSLNIAVAASILFYEIAQAAGASTTLPQNPRAPASLEALEGLYGHLQRMLLDREFLTPANPEHIMDTLRHIVRRADLDSRDVAILRGVLTKIDQKGSGETGGAGKGA